MVRMAKQPKRKQSIANDSTNLSPVSVQMVSLYGFLLWLDILCQGLYVNEIHAPYDRHHKVSTSLKPHLNGSVYMTSYGIRQMEK